MEKTKKAEEINYNPKDYSDRKLSNNIPGLGTDQLDSSISIRGKRYSGVVTISSSGIFEIKDVPFTPLQLEITGIIDGTGAISKGVYTYGQTVNCFNYNVGNGGWSWDTAAFYLDNGTDHAYGDISRATNRGFTLDVTLNSISSVTIMYIAYA